MLYKNTSIHAALVTVPGRTIHLEPGQEIESDVPIFFKGVDPVFESAPVEEKPVKTKVVKKKANKQKVELKEVTNGSRTETD